MGQGKAHVVSVDYGNNPCSLKVVMAHEAGCPAHNLDTNLSSTFGKWYANLSETTKQKATWYT